MAEKPSLNTRSYEIRWHGRGGQGAITAAKLAAQVAYLKGYQGATSAPSFGAERRGAPVSASARISPEPVMVISQVEKHDVVVVPDYTLLKYQEVTTGLGRGGWLIVNSWQHPEELNIKGDFNIATANASYPLDLYKKVRKAKAIEGTRFIHIFTPCPPGWYH